MNKLADEERKHSAIAGDLEEKHLTENARAEEDESHRKLFLLQVVQPGLAGTYGRVGFHAGAVICRRFRFPQKLGSISRRAGSVSIGAGISMGFAESLSDDGSLTGRGSPWIRGGATA